MKQETLKKIIELGEGFELKKDGMYEFLKIPNGAGISFDYLRKEKTIYPLLLRRAADGWNIKNPVYTIDRMSYCVEHFEKDNFRIINLHQDYEKTEYLTSQEQAIEACLVELLERDNDS